MKKNILRVIFLLSNYLIASVTAAVLAQDTSLINYLPLKVGNIWVYNGSSYVPPTGGGSWYDRYELTGITQINNKFYFVVNHTRIIIGGSFFGSSRLFYGDIPIRVDSLNLNIYKSTNCMSYYELLVDSLKSRRYDTSTTCDQQGSFDVCTDTSLYNIFGSGRPSKSYRISAFEGYNVQTYVKYIGMAQYQWHQLMSNYYLYLRGCVIDGILYGDTSFVVGINPTSNEVPSEYRMYQNYPNPFNGKSNIKYQIAKTGNVKLTIYDALGREVETIHELSLQPGTYEVSWDANNFPSGVYYYRLVGSDYSETKKMVLLK